MTQTLTLDGIWFPNYGSDKSKKNFRIVYFITCNVDKVDEKNDPIKNSAGEAVTQEVTIMVEKPKTKDFWQWRDNENLYLPPKVGNTDPVELDLSRLHTNDFGFQADNYRVEKFVGQLKSVRVQIYDVHDKNFGDYLRIILKAVGVDAIKLVAGTFLGLPEALVGLIAKGAMVFFGDGKEVADKIGDKDTEQKTKDKLLFSGFSDFDPNTLPLQIEGQKYLKPGKLGTYRVRFGFE